MMIKNPINWFDRSIYAYGTRIFIEKEEKPIIDEIKWLMKPII